MAVIKCNKIHVHSLLSRRQCLEILREPNQSWANQGVEAAAKHYGTFVDDRFVINGKYDVFVLPVVLRQPIGSFLFRNLLSSVSDAPNRRMPSGE